MGRAADVPDLPTFATRALPRGPFALGMTGGLTLVALFALLYAAERVGQRAVANPLGTLAVLAIPVLTAFAAGRAAAPRLSWLRSVAGFCAPTSAVMAALVIGEGLLAGRLHPDKPADVVGTFTGITLSLYLIVGAIPYLLGRRQMRNRRASPVGEMPRGRFRVEAGTTSGRGGPTVGH